MLPRESLRAGVSMIAPDNTLGDIGWGNTAVCGKAGVFSCKGICRGMELV